MDGLQIKYEIGTRTLRNTPGNHWIATVDSWDKGINVDGCAERMVACVNACKDFPDGALNKGVLQDVMRLVNEYSQWARVQGFKRNNANKPGYFLGLCEDIISKNEANREG